MLIEGQLPTLKGHDEVEFSFQSICTLHSSILTLLKLILFMRYKCIFVVLKNPNMEIMAKFELTPS